MSQFITKWNDKELMSMIEERVAAGMEAACDFAATRAEATAPVRTGILRGDVAYRVEAKHNEITGYVGVRKRRAFYAYFVELGTSKMKARPFLRPAVFNHAQEIVRLVARGGR